MIKSNYHTYTVERGGILGRFLGTTVSPKNAVLVHGLSSGSRTWDEAVVYLMNEGYNVLTLDLSGHGESGRVDQYSFGLWINNVLDTIEAHGIKKVDLLMGHSLGGLISVGAASRIKVDNMVLIDPLIVQPNILTTELIKRGLVAKFNRSLKEKIKSHPDRSAHTLLNDIYHVEKWDVKTLDGFNKEEGLKILSDFEALSDKPATLLVKPVKSMLLSQKDLEKFKPWGITIVELENVGHGLHLDDFEEFKKTVNMFIEGNLNESLPIR